MKLSNGFYASHPFSNLKGTMKETNLNKRKALDLSTSHFLKDSGFISEDDYKRDVEKIIEESDDVDEEAVRNYFL